MIILSIDKKFPLPSDQNSCKVINFKSSIKTIATVQKLKFLFCTIVWIMQKTAPIVYNYEPFETFFFILFRYLEFKITVPLMYSELPNMFLDNEERIKLPVSFTKC